MADERTILRIAAGIPVPDNQKAFMAGERGLMANVEVMYPTLCF